MSGLVRNIIFSRHLVAVACDGKCHKAWGINNRPRAYLDQEDPDNYAYLADHELEDAPEDSGTCEGECSKPRRPEYRMNKWCIRECERSSMHNRTPPTSDPEPFTELIDFNKRFFNIAPHYR